MRVLQLWYDAGHGGGVAGHVSYLSRQLEAHGHEVTGLRLTDGVKDEVTGTLRRIHELPGSYGPVQGLLLRPALKRILSEARPELVHVHGCFTTLSAVLLADLRRQAPVVGTLHDIRPFCYLMTRRFARTGALCQRRCGVGCFSSGCVRPNELADVLRLPRRWCVDALNLTQWSRLDRIIVPSTYLRDLARQHGIAAHRLRLIPHGTPVPYAPPEVRTEADPPLILFLGGLLRYKGPDLLIRALDRLRDRPWQAVLIGDGPLRETLQREAERLALAHRVQFYGHVDDHGVIERLLCRARLLALPSTIPESFSLAGIEALAMATPVVSFGLGGILEWLRDGENGLLAADGDVEDLARRMAQLLDDPHLARRLGEQGRAMVVRRFTVDLALERLLGVYAEAADVAKSA